MQLQQQNSITTDWKSLLKRSVSRGLSGLKVPEPLKLADWADENFYLSPESSSIVGAWETLPYQRQMMNLLSNDDIPIISIKKSARVGYTKMLVAATAYFIEHKKRSGVIYQPTDEDAEDFVKDEVDPALRDCPVWRACLKCDPEKKSSDNTLSKKGFYFSSLDIRGGKTPRNYRRLTKDFVIYDEIDGFDLDIGGEGSALKLGDKRIETSSFPKSIRGSTPKIKGTSYIDNSLLSAGLVFERALPCPHCGEFEPMRWSNIIWENRDPSTARLRCIHCEGDIYYSQYPEMDERGVWVTEEGIYIDDNDMFRDSDGNVVDPPRHVGMFIWSAYSYFQTWPQLVESYLGAIKEKETGDVTALKTFINTDLGEAWEEEGERADPHSLYQRREHYAAEVPQPVKVLTCFVDVQDDRFEFEVEGWAEGEESYTIDYQALYGNLSMPDIWDLLKQKLQRNYIREDGMMMPIKVTGIDSGGHFTDEVYEFSKKCGITNVIPTKGSKDYGKPIAVFPKAKNKNHVYLLLVGTDTAKDLIYQRFTITQGPGCYHHPATEMCDQRYFKQATAEEKIKKWRMGKPYFVWDAKKRRNEVLDCKVGNLAMIRVLQQHFGLDLAMQEYGYNPQADKPKPRKRIIRSSFMER